MKIQGLSEELLPVLMNGDRSTGLEIVNRLLEEGTDVITIYEGVIKPAMYKVGDLWEEGKISVAYYFVFANDERTLTDSEVDASMAAVVDGLKRELLIEIC